MKITYKSIFNMLQILTVSLVICSEVACKKLVEVDPPIQDIVGNAVYRTDRTATSVVLGIYTDMNNHGTFLSGISGMSLRFGAAADELVSIAPPDNIVSAIYKNAIVRDDGGMWGNLYGYIFRVNAAVTGINASTTLSSNVRNQLLGELRFLRALYYFYLVNTYGDVPLLLTTDIKLNATAPRMATVKIYDQIITDLSNAKTLLGASYVGADGVTSTPDRIRPNESVVSSLLARVYLYKEMWSEAETEASRVIDNPLYELEPIDRTFLKDSRETVWQLQTVAPSINTLDAQVFMLHGGNGVPEGPDGFARPVYISESLYHSFSSDDLRLSHWLDSVAIGAEVYPFPAKYKIWLYDSPSSEYQILFRLAEQYLIRSEARARQGKISGVNSAETDLNLIRQRAGLNPIIHSTPLIVLNAISDERRKELFTEYGDRWFDLKRTKKINDVMVAESQSKATLWEPYKQLYPIGDIQTNPSLRGHQNPGYPEF